MKKSLIFVLLFALPQALWAYSQMETAIALLKQPHHYGLLRHALAPGTGDPANFSLDDCSTQRNLSQQGRIQANRIGAIFMANGIESANVYTSQWCRCRDTARLMNLGPVKDLTFLNSFFRYTENKAPQLSEAKAWFASQHDSGATHKPTVMVTHQVFITAVTGIFPSSGELVVVKALPSGEVEAVTSVPFN